MYFVIASDLKMDKGKIGAQIGHASHLLYRLALGVFFPQSLPIELKTKKTQEAIIKFRLKTEDEQKILQDSFIDWEQKSYPKIVLKASREQMNELSSHCDEFVIDEGRTQIEKGSQTVLAWLPRPKEEFLKNPKLKSLFSLKLA